MIKRPLGNMEHALVLTDRLAPLPIVVILRLSNAPSPEKVQEALDTLQRHHLLLQAGIIQNGKQLLFTVNPQPPRIELRVLPRTGPDAWQSATNTELNQRLDESAGPLLRGTYLYSPPTGAAAAGDLILTAHHSIMDATSGLHFCRQLLALCTEGQIEEIALPGTAVRRSLTLPADALFPTPLTGFGRFKHTASFIGRQLIDEISFRRAAQSSQPPAKPGVICQVLTSRLPAEATTALARRARERRLSLNNVLLAAMLLAVYRQFHAGQTLSMRAINFADLRPYLDPPPPAETLGCHIAMLRQTLPVEPETGLWELAAIVQEKFYQANRRGDKYLFAATAKRFMQVIIRLQTDRMAHVALSYAGPLEIAPAYQNTRVEDVHTFVANNYLGPRYSAFAKILFGELSWDIVYMDGDVDKATAEAITDTMLNLLE